MNLLPFLSLLALAGVTLCDDEWFIFEKDEPYYYPPQQVNTNWAAYNWRNKAANNGCNSEAKSRVINREPAGIDNRKPDMVIQVVREDEVEAMEVEKCELVIWSADNNSPFNRLDLPEGAAVQYSAGIFVAPTINKGQSCFLHVNAQNHLHLPPSPFDNEQWINTLENSLNGMVFQVNQDTFDAKLYNFGKRTDKKAPIIAVLRLYDGASFVSLVEETIPIFTEKADSVSFKLEPGDLIVFLAPELLALYNNIFDLVGVFSEYSPDEPVQSFDDVRRNLQSALPHPLSLLAIHVK